MKKEHLISLENWFERYCRSFDEEASEEDRKNYALKEEHTHRVRENISSIARSLGLDREKALLAEAIGLFHDIGRFPQYRKYRIFLDSRSENHAALGAKVLIEEEVLKDLPKDDRDLIVRVVALHNVFALPAGLDESTLLLVRMIRDADKLDIWRVFAELYKMPEQDRASAAFLGLPDAPGVSPEVLDCIDRGEMARLTMLRTLTDFKLLQLSWIFDLNYRGSFHLLREQAFVDRIIDSLPREAHVMAAVGSIRKAIEKGLRHDRRP